MLVKTFARNLYEMNKGACDEPDSKVHRNSGSTIVFYPLVSGHFTK